MVGFLPGEFSRVQGEGTVKTVFFCDSKLTPDPVPENTLFICKEKALLHEFTQLVEFFDQSFHGENLNYVVFCLGSNDISHADKKLVFSEKEQSIDFHVTKNGDLRYVSQCYNALLEAIVDLKNVNKLISFDAMARASSGFHNAGVEYLNRRVEKVHDGHAHFNTWKRFQHDNRKRKDKGVKNFPVWSERFDDVDDGKLKNDEKLKLAAAAVNALTNDGNLTVDDAVFLRKF